MDKIPFRLRDATDPHRSNTSDRPCTKCAVCVPTQKGLFALRSMCVTNSVQLFPWKKMMCPRDNTPVTSSHDS